MAADYEIRFEPSRRRVRVEFNGAWVADSSRALILHETRGRSLQGLDGAAAADTAPAALASRGAAAGGGSN